jgi:hypothetical protein
VSDSIPFTIHVGASPDDRERSGIVTIVDSTVQQILITAVVTVVTVAVGHEGRRCVWRFEDVGGGSTGRNVVGRVGREVGEVL